MVRPRALGFGCIPHSLGAPRNQAQSRGTPSGDVVGRRSAIAARSMSADVCIGTPRVVLRLVVIVRLIIHWPPVPNVLKLSIYSDF